MYTLENNAAEHEQFPWQHLDQQVQALNAKLFSGLSPVSLALAQLDWALNLVQTPSAQFQLQTLAWQHMSDWLLNAFQSPFKKADADDSHATKEDARFSDASWQSPPWNSLVLAQHLSEQWWHQATQLRGMRPHSKEQMQFYANKWLDMASPSNWLATNPQALEAALHSNGLTLAKGANHAIHDWWKEHSKSTEAQGTPHMKPGDGLAMTPGEVVSRSHLCELIQYAPTTKKYMLNRC
jgi:polyhydroxyalkanoate synthase